MGYVVANVPNRTKLNKLYNLYVLYKTLQTVTFVKNLPDGFLPLPTVGEGWGEGALSSLCHPCMCSVIR